MSTQNDSRWTRESARQWPALAARLQGETGIDVQARQAGAFFLCFSEAELEARREKLAAVRDEAGGDYPYEILDRAALLQRLLHIGPTVIGASYSPMDGHVNPLKLLRALHSACTQRGVILRTRHGVQRITHADGLFTAHSGGQQFRAPKLMLAAGLGNAGLAGQVGLHAPVRPNRGMTAGAAQILLKNAGLAPSQPVVLAGCGPLLYLLAWQYLRAGVRIGAIVDTTQRGDYLRALRHIGGALAGWRDVRKGLGLIRSIRGACIPFYRGASDLAVEGGERATALSFRVGATSHRVQTDLVLLHPGVVPNNQITASLRLAHRWDDQQLCWLPTADAWGRLALDGFLIAGDGRGISGGAAAALQGQLAALAAAQSAGRLPELERDREAAPLRSALRRQLHIRPFHDTLYRPKLQHRVPADDVIACRCDEVSAGELRRMVALGCTGPSQTKAFSRCGMGPCQGRLCGLTVTEVIAQARGVSPAEVGHYRIRPPVKPITLEELAAL